MKNQNIDNIYPLTPLQEGMLFHALHSEDHFVYMEQMSIALNAKMDVTLLKKSFEILSQKYDVLRAAIVYEKIPRPLHVIKNKMEISFTIHDLTHLPENELKVAIYKIKKADSDKGFVLKKGPLFRLNYIKINAQKSILIFTFHHIILDGWSVAIVIKEFYQNYLKLSKNEQIEVSKYKNFNEYIKRIEEINKDQSLNYWKDYLKGFESLSSFSNKVEPTAAFNYDIHKFTLRPEAQKGITWLMDAFGITFSIAMQFVWGVMLARLSLNKDVVFGTIVSGRNIDLDQIESIVGMLINTIPVRIKFDNDKLEKKLEAFKSESFNSLNYQNCSLSAIQKQTDLPELFDQLLVFENYPYEELETEQDIKIEGVEVLEKTNYRFLVNITYSSNILIKISFDNKAYSEDMVLQIEKIINHLAETLPATLKTSTLDDIDVISEELNQTMDGFNDTDLELPQETLVSLFAKGVKEFPNNVAVKDSNSQWTWSQLDQYSDVIAQEILKLDINEEASVCLLLKRSNYMMAALLGVLKSGNAYVPLDPSIPESRQAFIIENSGARYVIKDTGANFKASWVSQVSIIEIEKLDFTKKATIKLPIVKANNLAYIIYTSGSTGKPKGVMIEHGSINNRLHWMQREYPIVGEDCILQKTNYAFDVSVWELFGWMFEGASLCFLKPDEEKDPGLIFNKLVTQKITRVHFVPSMLSVFMEYISVFEDVGELKNIDYFFSSGERLSKASIQKFNALIYPGTKARLLNMYGPTETTVEVSSHLCPLGAIEKEMPIGKPFYNSKIYVLDDYLNIMPIGFSGEIYIEGIQVARGYLGNEELTNQMFFESPFNKGRRMYKSGDIGRWNAKGEVEFLDRLDGQVKLRGYRIELNEIALTLKSIPKITQAVVLVHEENLIAFYTGQDISEGVLSKNMLETLPEYMIPNQFIFVAQWPMTTNGKTDVKFLKNSLKEQHNINLEEIKNEEGELAEIWKNILKITKVTSQDDFFNSGGHSLLAIRFVAQIQKKLSVKLNLKEVFFNPQFSQIKALIKTKTIETYSEIKIYEGEDIPLTGVQQRIYVLYHLLDKDATYHIPSIWKLKMLVDLNKLENALKKVIQRHAILRTSFLFEEETGVFKQIITDHVDIKIEHTRVELPKDFDSYSDRELQAFIKPFSLDLAPLLRMKLVSFNDENHLLFFDVHHIIFDGPSFQLFFKELLDFYFGRKLEPLKIQFKDFAYNQNQQLKGARLDQQKKYWLKQFESGIPLLNFTEANQRVDIQSRFGKVKNIKINEAQKSELQKLAITNNLTLNQLLFGAYVLLLMKKSKQKDLVVGTVVNTRSTEETQTLIGMFANTVAIPFYNVVSWDLKTFFNYIKTQLVHAIDNKEYPFDQLVNELNVERDVTRTPLFDVLYSMETGLTSNKLDNEALYPVQLKEKPVSYDLSFYVNEYEDHLMFYLEYDSYLFTEDWSQNILEEWQGIINTLSDKMEHSISQFCEFPEGFQEPITTLINDELIAETSSDYLMVHANNDLVVKLTKVWEELLNKEVITGKENFFNEGGHSILAIRLSLLLYKEIGIKIPFIQIFKAPVFEKIVSYLEASVDTVVETIDAIPKAPYYELSQAQKRMWVTHELSSQKHAYNITTSYVLTGDIDISKLKSSFRKIIETQDILRSYYKMVDGEPKMFINDVLEINWNEEDLTNKADPDQTAYAICEKAFGADLDLKQAPLFKIYLLKTAENKYWFSLVIHHMIIDGWSMRLLMENLIKNYNEKTGQIQESPKVQYKDFAYWQNNKLQGDFGAQLNAYWTRRFEKPLQINTGNKNLSNYEKTLIGETKLSYIDSNDFQIIKKLTSKNQWSHYQLLLGSLGAILCKRSKAQDQLILVSDSGRSHSELNEVIGFFINTLPFRYRFKEDETGIEMIDRVKDNLLEDLNHAQLPLDTILKKIKTQNLVAAKALMTIRLVYNDFDYGDSLKMSGIEAEEKRIQSDAGKFDLSITISPFNDKLSVQMEYNKHVYKDAELDKILNNWMTLIQQISEHPDQNVYDLLANIEKKRMLTSIKNLNQLANMKIEPIQIEDNA